MGPTPQCHQCQPTSFMMKYLLLALAITAVSAQYDGQDMLVDFLGPDVLSEAQIDNSNDDTWGGGAHASPKLPLLPRVPPIPRRRTGSLSRWSKIRVQKPPREIRRFRVQKPPRLFKFGSWGRTGSLRRTGSLSTSRRTWGRRRRAKTGSLSWGKTRSWGQASEEELD